MDEILNKINWAQALKAKDSMLKAKGRKQETKAKAGSKAKTRSKKGSVFRNLGRR